MEDDDLDHLSVTVYVDFLMVFWRSAVPADGVEHTEFVWEIGAVLAVHCHHE